MRLILFFICCSLTFTASAQWYRIDLQIKKRHERFPAIEQSANHSLDRIPVTVVEKKLKVTPLHFERSEYSYEAQEGSVMKIAQHNMRFREYNDASYNFSELAKLYILQNRYSEAKWYLLQSNLISRQQNDDKHTIDNLMNLATIKFGIGDYEQARQDLTEAHEIAFYKGFRNDLMQIEKQIAYLKQNKLLPPKADLRYAEAPDTAAKPEEK